MKVRTFLKAKTAEELVTLCSRNNIMRGRDFNYEPVFFAKGFFYTFFYVEIDREKVKSALKQDNSSAT